MNEKEQIERLYKHNLKVSKVMFVISMVLFSLATACIIGLAVMISLQIDVILLSSIVEGITLQGVLRDFFSLFISGGVVCILFSTLIFRRRAYFFKNLYENSDKIRFAYGARVNNQSEPVDVKPVEDAKPKGPYDDLIEEYRKLYEQNLITKEEFEMKKKELTR